MSAAGVGQPSYCASASPANAPDKVQAETLSSWPVSSGDKSQVSSRRSSSARCQACSTADAGLTGGHNARPKHLGNAHTLSAESNSRNIAAGARFNYSQQSKAHKHAQQAQAQPTRSITTCSSRAGSSRSNSNSRPELQQQQSDQVQPHMVVPGQLASLRSTQGLKAVRSNAARTVHPRRSAVDTMLQKQYDLQAEFDCKVQKWKTNSPAVSTNIPAGATSDEPRIFSSSEGPQETDMCEGSTSAAIIAAATGGAQASTAITAGGCKEIDQPTSVVAEGAVGGVDADGDCVFSTPNPAERSAYNQHTTRLRGEVCYTQAVPPHNCPVLAAPISATTEEPQQTLSPAYLAQGLDSGPEQVPVASIASATVPTAVGVTDKALQHHTNHIEDKAPQFCPIKCTELALEPSLQESMLWCKPGDEVKQTLQQLLADDSEESAETWLVAAHQPQQQHSQQLCLGCQHPPICCTSQGFRLTRDQSDAEQLLEPLQQQCPSLPMVQLPHEQGMLSVQLKPSAIVQLSNIQSVAGKSCLMSAADCCFDSPIKHRQAPVEAAEQQRRHVAQALTSHSAPSSSSCLALKLVDTAVDIVSGHPQALADDLEVAHSRKHMVQRNAETAGSVPLPGDCALADRPAPLQHVQHDDVSQSCYIECHSRCNTECRNSNSTTDGFQADFKPRVVTAAKERPLSGVDRDKQPSQQQEAQAIMPNACPCSNLSNDPVAAAPLPSSSSSSSDQQPDGMLHGRMNSLTSTHPQPGTVGCSIAGRTHQLNPELDSSSASILTNTTAGPATVETTEHPMCDAESAPDGSGIGLGPLQLRWQQLHLQPDEEAGCQLEEAPASDNLNSSINSSPVKMLSLAASVELTLSPPVADAASPDPGSNATEPQALRGVELTCNVLDASQGSGGVLGTGFIRTDWPDSSRSMRQQHRTPADEDSQATACAGITLPGSTVVLSDVVGAVKELVYPALSAAGWSSEGLPPLELLDSLMCISGDGLEKSRTSSRAETFVELGDREGAGVHVDVAAKRSSQLLDSPKMLVTTASSSVCKQLVNAATTAGGPPKFEGAVLPGLSGMSHAIALLLNMKHQLQADVSAARGSLFSLEHQKVTQQQQQQQQQVQQATAGSHHAVPSAATHDSEGSRHVCTNSTGQWSPETAAAALHRSASAAARGSSSSVQRSPIVCIPCMTRSLSSQVLHQMYPAPDDGATSDHDHSSAATGSATAHVDCKFYSKGSVTVCLVDAALRLKHII